MAPLRVAVVAAAFAAVAAVASAQPAHPASFIQKLDNYFSAKSREYDRQIAENEASIRALKAESVAQDSQNQMIIDEHTRLMATGRQEDREAASLLYFNPQAYFAGLQAIAAARQLGHEIPQDSSWQYGDGTPGQFNPSVKIVDGHLVQTTGPGAGDHGALAAPAPSPASPTAP